MYITNSELCCIHPMRPGSAQSIPKIKMNQTERKGKREFVMKTIRMDSNSGNRKMYFQIFGCVFQSDKLMHWNAWRCTAQTLEDASECNVQRVERTHALREFENSVQILSNEFLIFNFIELLFRIHRMILKMRNVDLELRIRTSLDFFLFC